MENIKSAVFIISIVIILTSLLNIINPEENSKNFFHHICTIFIIFITVQNLSKSNLEKVIDIDFDKYKNNFSESIDVESELLLYTEQEIEHRLESLLLENSIFYSNIDVELELENNVIDIKKIVINKCDNRYKTSYIIKNYFEEEIVIEYD